MRRPVFGLVVFAACGTAAAQQPPPPGLPSPRIQNVFPAGAKAGPPRQVSALAFTLKLDTEITVIGTDLDEPESLHFSHPGIKGDYLAPPAPPADPAKKDPPPKAKAN